MKNWQFNVLFFVGVGGAVVLLLGPELGLKINQNPTAITGIGAILTYILTQKTGIAKPKNPKSKQNTDPKKDEQEDDSDE